MGLNVVPIGQSKYFWAHGPLGKSHVGSSRPSEEAWTVNANFKDTAVQCGGLATNSHPADGNGIRRRQGRKLLLMLLLHPYCYCYFYRCCSFCFSVCCCFCNSGHVVTITTTTTATTLPASAAAAAPPPPPPPPPPRPPPPRQSLLDQMYAPIRTFAFAGSS